LSSPIASVRLFATNSASSVLTRLLQLTVFVWANQYLLRRIEPEEYSLFPVIMSLTFFADIFKNLLIGGLARYIVEADSRDDKAGITRIVSSMFPIVIVAASLILAAGAVAAWKIETIINVQAAYRQEARLMLLLLALTLCVNVVSSPFTEGLYVRQRFVTLNFIDLGCEGLRITILLFLLFNVSTQVMWLVVASTCAAIANVTIRVLVTRRLLPAARVNLEFFSLQTVRTLLRFGAWTSVGGLTGLATSTLPSLLLNRLSTPFDVAAFYLGRLPDIQIRGLAGVASGPALPALTRIYATRGEGSLNDLYYRGGRYFLWFTLLLVAPAMMFAKEIIHLYAGERYAAASIVMIMLLAAYPFHWASAMFYKVAHATARIGAYYVCDILIQAVTALALFYAIHRGYGAPGAGLAIAVVGGGLHLLLIWPMGLRLVNGSWKQFILQTIIPGVVPFLSALLVCHTFRAFVDLNSWSMIVIGSGIGATVYCAALGAFCLDSLDRSLLARAAARFRTLWPLRYMRAP
jgi:O-antigen/teichoic acid export membrane protein